MGQGIHLTVPVVQPSSYNPGMELMFVEKADMLIKLLRIPTTNSTGSKNNKQQLALCVIE